MKNMFAALNYNLGLALAGVAGQFVLLVWPWIAQSSRAGRSMGQPACVVVGCLAVLHQRRRQSNKPALVSRAPIGALVGHLPNSRRRS